MRIVSFHRAEMKPTGGGEKPATEGSALVIVGVNPDERSREVLTWSLVNVTRPGDRIIALHVLDYSLGSLDPSFASPLPSLRSKHLLFLNFVLIYL